jgi:hypothetical protein
MMGTWLEKTIFIEHTVGFLNLTFLAAGVARRANRNATRTQPNRSLEFDVPR